MAPGSSPHTRGALYGFVVHGLWRRIIPAYAGSTFKLGKKFSSWEGSSPHTRGARGGVLVDVAGAGIIPAYAGSTPGAFPRLRRQRDHPRIRGEHQGGLPRPDHDKGSSPHTRGARRWRCTGARDRGIIPAYAGSTNRILKKGTKMADHPRIRGEHVAVLCAGLFKVGSSPHTRGARKKVFLALLGIRIIPAYAGSTVRCPA